jgi:hypothetical protein
VETGKLLRVQKLAVPSISTQVSKAHPGFKKILSASVTVPEWRGRSVYAVQVDPGWVYSLYNDMSEPYVYQIEDISGRLAVRRVPKPTYGGPATQVDAPSHGKAVVRGP